MIEIVCSEEISVGSVSGAWDRADLLGSVKAGS